MSSTINTRNRIIEVIRRGQRGLDGDVGLTTTVTKATTFTAVAGERGYVYRATAAITANFEAAATLTNGWHAIIDAVGGDVTLDPDGAETINGVSTLVVPSGGAALVYSDGSALYAQFFFGSTYAPISGFPTAADKYLYSDGPGSWVEGDITAAGRALLDDADASAQLTTLGVSAFGETLLDDADDVAGRATLGLGSAAVADLLDEDDLVSDDATAAPSQQSVKAYVDTAIGNIVAGWEYVETLFDHSVDGNTAGPFATSNFEDGYEYMILVNNLSGTLGGSLTLAVYRETTGAWSGAAATGGSSSSSDELNAQFLVRTPRLVSHAHIIDEITFNNGGSWLNTQTASNTAEFAGFTHATAQKIRNVRLGLDAGLHDSGTIHVVRRQASVAMP